ncbi:MAG: phosphoribosylaminoimidazolesuccinocarboxamide synthase [Treponema sp.]|nr:phosphoribosylaminoimidazolesuccinocarboxamide synthase [Treponema sp.]
MELIKTGKTKDVYKLPDGNFLFKFKDTITGSSATGESDPGGNQVVGSVDGVGSAALKMSAYYFELFKKKKINTHYVSADLTKNEMTVRPAVFLGNGLEFVVRYKATGSFVRRFGAFCKEGDVFVNPVFEVTLKDDEREDPPVTGEILAALKILTPSQFNKIKKETLKICNIIKNDLTVRGLELIDIKVEFGMVNGKLALIDEVSAGNMRVYQNNKKIDYITLSKHIK